MAAAGLRIDVSRRQRPPVRTQWRLPPPLIQSPAFVLIQAGQLAMAWATEALELFELTVAEFATLALIGGLGPMTQAALADRLGMSQTSMSRIASSLEKAGLATRQPDYFDGRSRRVGLTEAGSELLAEAADELRAVGGSIPEEVLTVLGELPPEYLGPIMEKVRKLGWG